MTYSAIPYLTSVMASRNDNYGGDASRRMQIAIDARLQQLEKHKIESEFILIEWNPPIDRSSLKDSIIWPKQLKYCTIRIITVPPSIHDRYAFADKLAVNIHTALNTGIRRARGRFILPGNMDIIYSDEVMEYIARRLLDGNTLYRVNRLDIEKGIVESCGLQSQLKFARNHIIREHPPSGKALTKNVPALHTNAAGDFLLMSNDNWKKLQGFRESDILSAYSDGLICFSAFAAGIREIVLPKALRVYHIDHSGTFNERSQSSGIPFEDKLAVPWLPERVDRFLHRIIRIILTSFGYRLKGNVDGIPTLHFFEYQRLAREIVKAKRSFIFNDKNWGLGGNDLEEFIQNTAEWDRER